MSASDLQTVSLPVLGMTCAGCASSVQTVLGKQQGIQSAVVNYATQQVKVVFEPDLIQPPQFRTALQAAGYDLILDMVNARDKQAEVQADHYRALKKKTILAAALTFPVVVIGMFMMQIRYANYYMLVLSTPVLFVFGKDFFINAFKQARQQRANMDSLVALSTGISYIFSVFNTFYHEYWHSKGMHPHVYYEAAAVVIVFIMLGKLLEERAKSNTSSAIKKLIGLQPRTVVLISADGEKEVEISAVRKGDLLAVKPGAKIPLDGTISWGKSYVDESMLSGEPLAVSKEIGDSVYAGTLNQKGSFRFYAEKVGGDTLLAQIIQQVQEAQGSKAPVQKLVDKIAGIFVPVVIFIAITTLLIWLLAGGQYKLSHGLMAMVSVLVIACPCALGLATPTAIMVGIGKGAESGMLIKDAEALEIGYKVDTVVLDKTGTLTMGRPTVNAIRWASSEQQNVNSLRAVLVALEQQSEHPLAGAVVSYLQTQSVSKADVGSFKSTTGIGVEAVYEGESYFAGSDKMFLHSATKLPEELSAFIRHAQQSAMTVIYFGNSKQVLAVLSVTDELKPGSKEAVEELQAQGIRIYMLTGDADCTAAAVAGLVGISHYKASMMPSEKADYIQDLQRDGRVVAMVGDGINDSQALAQADFSVAMAKGSDIAIDVAKLTLISSDLRQVSKALKLSAATVSTIRQNLFWAFIYNVIGIPLAAGILYPVNGFLLNPMIAGAAMALSSVSVVSNSLRLKLMKL
jgi:Cu2+-exporting ATPase